MTVLDVLERGMSTYCESGIGLFDTQAINTISNIVIIISAYFSYRLVRIHRIENLTIRILPLIVLLIGIGSMLWHGTPNLLTSWADTLPISVFVLVSFFFLLGKFLSNRNFVWGTLFVFILIEFPFIFGILPSFNGFIPYSIALIFGLFIFLGLAKRYKIFIPQLALIIPLFISSFFFRTIDLTICSTFPVGTHFIWHILNASVFYLFIRLFVKIEAKYLNKK